MRSSKAVALLAGWLLVFLYGDNAHANRYMERLDRGVIAIHLGGSQVYIGWRFFGTDTDTTAFNVYRDSTRINSIAIIGSTNYTDTAGSTASTYTVRPVVNGIEQEGSAPVSVWAQQYLDIPLQVPAGILTPDGVTCTYSPNDCSVGDLDADGQYEIILKWDPSNSKDNSLSGYTGNVYLDAYELDGTFMWRIDLGINIRAGAHYTQFMVYDLDSDGKAEVACKTADGTVDGTGVVLGDAGADYRNSDGYVLSGPEYLSVFNGQTGAFMDTVTYVPPRGTVSSWGDSYGNRVDRFLACVAYLDGQHPSLVMCRGYYTRAVLAAWDFQNGQLTQRWIFDSNNGYSTYAGQGNHNLSVGDVDADGFDEIVYGSCAIDHDGTGLYNIRLGHGDAMHLGNFDPDRPGLEVFDIHEPAGDSTIGSEFRDAAAGEIIWSMTPGNVGRGCADDIYAGNRGAEMWAGNTGGLRDRYGNYLGRTPGSTNFLAWWDGDLVRELLDGNHIDKYGISSDTRLLTASDCTSNNTTKSTPCLVADILGDWREEVILRTNDNTALRLYTATTVTGHRIYTLMHDPQYRLAVTWQNVAYNQPPHTGFFLGEGMETPPDPQITYPVSGSGGLSFQWWLGVEGSLISDLTSAAAYPASPSGSGTLDRFEGYSNYNDNYGARVRGWLVPPADGDYTFWAAADESAELRFSTDAMAENATMIAYVPASTDPLQWDKYVSQQSGTITLAAGHKYYIELLHKDAGGDDHFAVAWQGPGLGQQVIEGNYLLPWVDRLAGDLTDNGRIDLKDLATFSRQWLTADCGLDLYNDLNGDCQIDLPDALIMGENWLFGASVWQHMTIQIQENEPGFVAVNGTMDNNNAGFTGTGFANTANAIGAWIDWSINVPQTGTYDLRWRFANGTAVDRTAVVSVNGLQQISNISFAPTGSWTTWNTSAVTSINLFEGDNTIRLAAETANGLANIDWIEITGLSPVPN